MDYVKLPIQPAIQKLKLIGNGGSTMHIRLISHTPLMGSLSLGLQMGSIYGVGEIDKHCGSNLGRL